MSKLFSTINASGRFEETDNTINSGNTCLIDPMSTSTHILGLGNPVIGDDGIGIRVIRELEQKLNEIPDLSVSTSCQSGLYLLEHLIGFQKVIIVDAVIRKDLPVGTIIINMDIKAETHFKGHSPHFIGIHGVLSLGRAYGLKMPEDLILLGIVIHNDKNITEQMSPEMEKKYGTIVKQVLKEINVHTSHLN